MLARKALRSLIDTPKAYAWLALAFFLPWLRPPGPTLGRRHALLFLTTFPPDVSGGVYRPLSWLRAAPGHGWRFTVVTPEFPGVATNAGRHLLGKVPATIATLYVPQSKRLIVNPLFPRVDGGLHKALSMMFTGADGCRYDPPDTIVATAPQFSSFVAGGLLARYFRAKLVLDYRDEWTECPFDFVRKGHVDRVLERWCQSRAHAVIFTTESQRAHQRKVFSGLCAERCHVIPNGWELEDAAPLSATVDTGIAPVKFTVSFVGTLGDYCPPGNFLDCLGKVLRRNKSLNETMSLQFVGTKSTRARDELSRFAFRHVIRDLDQVTKPEADHISMTSDCLLLINSQAFSRYIPGKLYAYMATGVPILVYGRGGEIGRIVESLDAGIVVDTEDDEAMERALVGLLGRNRPTEISAARRAWLEQHTRERLAGQMFRLIETLHDLDDGSGRGGNRAGP